MKGSWEDATPSNGQSYSLLQRRFASLTWPRPDGDVLIAGVYTDTSELVYDGTTTYTWPNVRQSKRYEQARFDLL